MWWWAEVSAGGTRSSGTVIFAMRARHSARRPHRTGASACRTRAVTLLRQPDIVGVRRVSDANDNAELTTATNAKRYSQANKYTSSQRRYSATCAVSPDRHIRDPRDVDPVFAG